MQIPASQWSAISAAALPSQQRASGEAGQAAGRPPTPAAAGDALEALGKSEQTGDRDAQEQYSGQPADTAQPRSNAADAGSDSVEVLPLDTDSESGPAGIDLWG
jgi:hypothetical protein